MMIVMNWLYQCVFYWNYYWYIGLYTFVIVCFLPIWRILYDVFTVNFNYFKWFCLQRKPAEEFTSFYYKNTKRNNIVTSKIKTKVGDYLPPLWYSPDIGTIIAFGVDPKLPYKTEKLKSNHDQEEFLISWYPKKPTSDESRQGELKIILFFPGLGLTAKSVRNLF
jgi:hypothetical protein